MNGDWYEIRYANQLMGSVQVQNVISVKRGITNVIRIQWGQRWRAHSERDE